MRSSLDDYEATSGQQVNFSRSSLSFSPNMKDDLRSEVLLRGWKLFGASLYHYSKEDRETRFGLRFNIRAARIYLKLGKKFLLSLLLNPCLPTL